MKIISEEEMARRLDFRRPLHPAPEPPESMWCIPFEFGGAAKGTCISIAKAREIAAELRASIAEAEQRLLRREFDVERKRNDDLLSRLRIAEEAAQDVRVELAELKQKLRRRRAALTKRAEPHVVQPRRKG